MVWLCGACKFVKSIRLFATFPFDGKLYAYGFDENSTKYSKDYLSNRKQKKEPPYWHTVPEQVFSCEFCEISKNTFFTESLRTTASEDKNKQYVYQMNIKLHFGPTDRNLMPTNLNIFLSVYAKHRFSDLWK